MMVKDMEGWMHNFLVWRPARTRGRRRVRAATLRLAPGKLIVREIPPAQVCCAEGILWITQAGNAQDMVLRSGERFFPAAAGRMVIEALAPTVLRIAPREVSGGFLP